MGLDERKYPTKNPMTITFQNCLREMVKSGQYIPHLRWLFNQKVSRSLAEALWRAAIAPNSVTQADIAFIFFGQITPDRYFEHAPPAEDMNRPLAMASPKREEPIAVENGPDEDYIPIVDGRNIQGADREQIIEDLLLDYGYGIAIEKEPDVVKAEETLVDALYYMDLCRGPIFSNDDNDDMEEAPKDCRL
ncbi:hypothetical protein R1sor_021293 [Riccia sorocarpa]|uniref:Uncharacterized protein n=1 Tax=Riccia sorocarpa TaxID=122646 RepID=A0ABD3GJK5_9MARC